MPAPTKLQLTCPAKVNLSLSVGAPQPPKNFHPIASWMATVYFGDQLTLEKSLTGKSEFDIAFDPTAPKQQVVDWPLQKDLVFRAHAILESHAQQALPVQLTLRKFIPAGAGLGGGSSDAAAALVGLNQLFDLHTPVATLMNLGAQLGSDLPFLISALHPSDQAAPAAIVTGLGEGLEPAPLRDITHLVLVFPPFGCPTGPVYQAFDRLFTPDQLADHPQLSRVRDLAKQSPLPQDGPFNDLTPAACAVVPELADIMRRLAGTLSLPVHMSGSGSTLFVVSPSDITAKATARKITALTGLPALATRTR